MSIALNAQSHWEVQECQHVMASVAISSGLLHAVSLPTGPQQLHCCTQ